MQFNLDFYNKDQYVTFRISRRSLLIGVPLLFFTRFLRTAEGDGNTTGNALLRAGLPFGWQAGDKTGSGEHGSTNDIAIVWPPSRKPLLIAAYLTGSTASISQRNDALAEVGRIVTSELVSTRL
ncbi:beta-lactamase [Candidatus Magnetobacterium bavaricum]|uniref:Beta-lactamase n=1 Tax=Candidatus Magnetobacterium bavaricum TaxID=29290 RepID=A0A0F3GRU5_9BACT|nr:beta-lactamase [Candidatus Magnetobacterium bavaricum]